jgi:hypothetical protein
MVGAGWCGVVWCPACGTGGARGAVFVQPKCGVSACEHRRRGEVVGGEVVGEVYGAGGVECLVVNACNMPPFAVAGQLLGLRGSSR